MPPKIRNAVPIIDTFNFPSGKLLAGKYEVITLLGAGWEGEVYLIRERATGIERTAKFFFPQRNLREQASKFYALKLHKLRHCPIVIQYYTQDTTIYHGSPITFLVSEFVEGELLSQFIKRFPQKRLSPFQAIHMLHALATGIECIHQMGEYHGDLHSDNIIVQNYGLEFNLKLLDLFHWGAPRKEHIHDDAIDLIRIFYECLGGQKYYSKQPSEIKAICCGLKKSLILKKFRSAGQIRAYLESMQWDQ